MTATQTIKKKTTKKVSSSKTNAQNSGHKRCPTCGKYMKGRSSGNAKG